MADTKPQCAELLKQWQALQVSYQKADDAGAPNEVMQTLFAAGSAANTAFQQCQGTYFDQATLRSSKPGVIEWVKENPGKAGLLGVAIGYGLRRVMKARKG